jgi:NADH-quinone oxidoreductase subunit N
MNDTIRFGPILPELILTATMLVVLLLDAFRRGRETGALWGVTLAGIVAAGLAAATLPASEARWFDGLIHGDAVRRYLLVAMLIAGSAAWLVARDYVDRFRQPVGEAAMLILASLIGMATMASTTNLGLMFLGLELMSIPLYALTAFRFNDGRGSEGAVKYFILGSAAGAMFLMGAALIYGETGTLDALAAFGRIPLADGSPAMQTGAVLILVGMAFKLALVPFHSWSPDAYEGAPAPWTAFMSTAVKVAVVGAMVRVFFQTGGLPPAFVSALVVLAVLTMVVGNLLAVGQTNFKRLLAYSSVAHAGYLTVGLVAGTPDALAAAAFYLVVYGVMNVAAFGILIALSKDGEEFETIDDLRGLARREPQMAFLLMLVMMSLAGLPPLAGFTAKLMLFGAAVSAGWTWLVVLAVVASVVGAYYYLRPAVRMYLDDGEGRPVRSPGAVVRAVLALLVVVLLWLGLAPAGLLGAAELAFRSVLGGA